MSLSLYEGNRRRAPGLLMVLVGANLVIAASAIFFWAVVSVVMAEPIRWATGHGVGSRPELLDYPFVLLWLIPVAGACGAWVAMKAEQLTLAYFLAFAPLIYFGLIFGWYYLAPGQWQ